MNRALPGLTPAAVGRMALPLLETSLAANPADGPAGAAKGTALWLLARAKYRWRPSGPRWGWHLKMKRPSSRPEPGPPR